jgi:hypothetical protein
LLIPAIDTVIEHRDLRGIVTVASGILKSPNEHNRGGEYYCVTGHCRAVADFYWDNTGRAGGP